MTTPDYHAMTDQELADHCRYAYAGLKLPGTVADDGETVVLIENAICERLNLPLNETERGLTKWAVDQITDFVAKHKTLETTYVLAVGTPWDGIKLYGPFDTVEQAEDAFMRDTRIGDDYYEVVPVEQTRVG